MKQRITIEQLNELSDEQKDRIREWWCPLITEFNPVENLSDDQKKRLWDWRMERLGEHFAEWHSFYSAFKEAQHYWCEKDDFYDDYPFHMSEYDLPLLSIGKMIECLQGLNKDWTLNGSSWDEPDICDRLWERLKYYL